MSVEADNTYPGKFADVRESIVPEESLHFVGADELCGVVRAPGNHTQHVFGQRHDHESGKHSLETMGAVPHGPGVCCI